MAKPDSVVACKPLVETLRLLTPEQTQHLLNFQKESLAAQQLRKQEQTQYWLDKRKTMESKGSLSDEAHIAERQAWVKAARKRCHPGAPERCAVCGKYTKLCHAHHVAPLALQFEHGFVIPDQRFEWLCPNHHGLVHLAIDVLMVGQSRFEFFADVEPAEVEAVMTLARLGIQRLKESGE